MCARMYRSVPLASIGKESNSRYDGSGSSGSRRGGVRYLPILVRYLGTSDRMHGMIQSSDGGKAIYLVITSKFRYACLPN